GRVTLTSLFLLATLSVHFRRVLSNHPVCVIVSLPLTLEMEIVPAIIAMMTAVMLRLMPLELKHCFSALLCCHQAPSCDSRRDSCVSYKLAHMEGNSVLYLKRHMEFRVVKANHTQPTRRLAALDTT